MRPLQCDLHPWIQLYNRGRGCEGRTARTDKVPHIDAGSHFRRKNIKFRAIPNVQTSPLMRSALTASHYNCADHLGNQQDGCSHSDANCNSKSPNTRAQRIESFTDHLRAALTMGATGAPNSCTRRTNEVPPIDAGSHFVWENTGPQGFVRFLTPTHHLYKAFKAASPLQPVRLSISHLSTSYLQLPTTTYYYLLLPTTTYYYY